MPHVNISKTHPEAYKAMLALSQISAIVWLVVEINAWNRIAVASHYPVAP